MSALTVLLALSPIIWLIVALSILKLPAWQATSVAAIGSFIIAITAFQSDPLLWSLVPLKVPLWQSGQSY